MVLILRETEGEPATQPGFVRWSVLAGNDLAGDPFVADRVVWRRIEEWVSTRWAARSVTWIVRGPGPWEPRLRPFTVATVERFEGGAWVAATPDANSLGGYDLGCYDYRIAGTAGDDSAPPAAVAEAFRRLAEYVHGVAKAWNTDAAHFGGEDVQLVAGWAAKGLHLSGAADLLRPWRGLGR